MKTLSAITSGFEALQAERLGKKMYQQRQYFPALEQWQSAANFYRQSNLYLHQARVLNNISLVYQALGDWPKATSFIRQSLDLLGQDFAETDLESHHRSLAQALNTQASLWFAIGRTQDALTTWEEAIATYTSISDETGILRARINKAQAMQELGHHRQAIEFLTNLSHDLELSQPQSSLQATVLRHLGNTLRLIGEQTKTQEVLTEALSFATRDNNVTEIPAILFSLGQTAQAQKQWELAFDYYEQTLSYDVDSFLKIQVQLAQIRVLLGMEQWNKSEQLWRQASRHLSSLPHQRSTVYAYIGLSQQLTELIPHYRTLPLSSLEGWANCIQLLTDAIHIAQEIGDHRAETYALGYLGHVYEETQQWPLAQQLTHQALLVAQQYKEEDIEYRWQWQLGRILKADQDQEGAIAAYSEAVNHLGLLRGDLVATSSEEQFRFQEEVEPVYRELVGLLLTPREDGTIPQAYLSQARNVMEAFQIAELDNFFKEACLDDSQFHIGQVDKNSAVIYPIILDDRLDVIVSVPNQPFYHSSITVEQDKLYDFISILRDNLVIRSRMNFLPQVQQLYDWMLRPLENVFQQNEIKTLVFVLDGPLRQIPMSVLHDGNHYLIESYQVAIAPGLTLLDTQTYDHEEWRGILAGLSQARHGFSPLSYVKRELKSIRQSLNSTLLLDEAFTSQSLQQKVQTKSAPLIHIASHGQFGSNPEETFILTWDQHLNIRQLQHILQTNVPNTTNLELLVLSACETATGDPKAPLGLAGMAVRAGARSTLATLWAVNDGVTAQFMDHFYQYLADGMPKAEALRQTQLWILNSRRHQHPIYWAPYILIGNWT
ncbi:MAG: CHAT domain-containing protein [Cyanobacteria bacterium P01_F01_bin.150]